jgi:hypothetical protein
MHIILRENFLVNWKSTPTGGVYSFHMAIFPQSPQDGPVNGVIGAVLPCLLFFMVNTYVLQDVTHKSMALCAKGQFGQRVRQVVICLAVSDQ